MATNGIIDGADVFAERHGAEQPVEFQAQFVAQAAEATPAPIAAAPQAGTVVVTVAGDNSVKLPAGTSIEKIEIDGDSLVLVQPDGTRIVIEHAALHVPTFIIDDVEIPQEALVAALQANQIDVAAGPDGSLAAVAAGSESAGGNFDQPFPGIGDAGPIIDLLPPTALQFGSLEERELYPAERLNRGPSIDPEGGNAEGGINVGSITVDEAGLDGIGSEGVADSEIVESYFTISDPDGPNDIASLTINGTKVALGDIVGRSFDGLDGYGTLTITGYDPESGRVDYKYELTSPVTGEPANNDRNIETGRDRFEITVTDRQGAGASAVIRVDIIDDIPVARDVDAGTLTEDGVETTVGGNVASGYGNLFGADGAAATGSVAFGAVTAKLDGVAVNLADYGELVRDASSGEWSFVLDSGKPATQALKAGDTIDVSFPYTLKDGDADTDEATVSFQIAGADDSATVIVTPSDDAAADGAASVVYEAGLDAGGTDAGADSETDTGTFGVTATDGIATVTIGGVEHTLAEWAIGDKVVDTDEGEMTITGVTVADDGKTATFTYEYTLKEDQTHADAGGNNTLTDTVAVSVAGIGGTSATSDVTITIIDDIPVARDVDAGTLTEDGVETTVGGNVASGYGNLFGADGAAATGSVAFGAVTAKLDGVAVNLADYGELVRDASSGEWSFVLDSGKPATQALKAGDTIDVSFPYTLKDGDADTDEATVSFQIAGADDSATVIVTPSDDAAADGAASVVYEAGLDAGGTDAGADSETDTGTFGVTATDGIATVTIGGVEHTLAEWAIGDKVVDTDEGEMTITGVTVADDGKTATFTYEYTLKEDQTHADAGGNNTLTDTVAVSVAGIGGTSATSDVTITIVDDVPAIQFIESKIVDNVSTSHGGVWSFAPGADGLARIELSLTNEEDVSYIKSSSSVYDANTGTATYTAFFDEGGTQPYFTVTLNPDGTYQFEVISAVPSITIKDESSFKDGSIGGNPTAIYLEQIIAAKDPGAPPPQTDIKFTGNSNWTSGTNLGTSTTVNSNNNGLGVGSAQTLDNKESITLQFLVGDGGNTNTHPSTIRGVDHIEIDFLEGSAGKQMPASYSVYVITYDENGGVISQGTQSILNGTLTIESDELIYGVSIVNTGNKGLIVSGATTSVTTSIESPVDVELSFNVNVVDGDGDTASQGFDIVIDADDGHSATLESSFDGYNMLTGGPGDDILIGGPGQNTLTGGAGDDTFVIDASSASPDLADIIMDYGDGNDIVDLTELLGGTGASETTLDNYVHIAESETGAPQGFALQVDTGGTGANFVTVAYLNTNAGVQILYHDDQDAALAPGATPV